MTITNVIFMNCYCSFKALYCNPIPTPVNGGLTSPATTFLDTESQTITCSEGYTPVGGAATATCTANADGSDVSWIPPTIASTTCGKRCAIIFSGGGVGSWVEWRSLCQSNLRLKYFLSAGFFFIVVNSQANMMLADII